MRILVRSLAFGFCFASFGYAATITVDTLAFVNYADGTTRVTDNTGSVVVGTYSAEPSFTDPPTVSQVLTGLAILGGTSTFEDSLGGFDGFFRFDLDVTIPVSFDGDDVYIVLGNNATLASSTEFLVWKATSNPDGNTFSEDEVSAGVGGPGSIVLNNSTGTLLLGSFDGSEFSLDAIPEPSTTSALMLCGLAMLARRRR